MGKNKISRRRFIEGTGGALVVVAATPIAEGQQPTSSVAPAESPAVVSRTTIRVVVNGTTRRIEVEDRWTLVELLRDHLGLTGTKIGCDRGECGACTVLMDGKPVYSCSNLAVWADGRSVDTVEGLARGGRLDPLQQAFIDHDAPQCGFCTSGQLMVAKALLVSNPNPTADEVRRAMVGNLCRCSNYNSYVEAVLAAASTTRRGASSSAAAENRAATGRGGTR